MDLVRIKVENGSEVTVSAAFAKSVGAEVIKDAETTDRFGRPLGPTRNGGRRVKPRTTVKKAAAKKAAARKAASSQAATTSGGVAADSSPEEATK